MSLSIIIPIYNVESTLRRCIDSVLAQGINDCEILLIDDGSTDNSPNIADDYANKYNNIYCYHKTNGGLSDARNYGIERAKGLYLTFVDSDDEVAPFTYAPLMRILATNKRYDIIEYPVLQNPGRHNQTLFNPGSHEFSDALDWLAYKGSEHCWMCNKIFKTSIFDDLRFPKGKKFEDILAHISIIKKKPFIATTEQGMYVYHYNENGIAAKDRAYGFTELLEAQMQLVEKLNINTQNTRWHRLYMDMLTIQTHAYHKTHNIVLMPQTLRLTGYVSWKDSLKALLNNCIGLKLTVKLLSGLVNRNK